MNYKHLYINQKNTYIKKRTSIGGSHFLTNSVSTNSEVSNIIKELITNQKEQIVDENDRSTITIDNTNKDKKKIIKQFTLEQRYQREKQIIEKLFENKEKLSNIIINTELNDDEQNIIQDYKGISLKNFFHACHKQNIKINYEILQYIYTQILRIVQTLIKQNFYHTDLKLDNFVIDPYFKVNIIDYESIIEMKDDDENDSLYRIVKTKQFKDIIADGGYTLTRKKILKLIALSLIQLEDEIFNYHVYFNIKSENFNLNNFIDYRLNEYNIEIEKFKIFVSNIIDRINEKNNTKIGINYVNLINNNLINKLNYIKLQHSKENPQLTLTYILSNIINLDKHSKFLIYLFIIFSFSFLKEDYTEEYYMNLDLIRQNTTKQNFKDLFNKINNNNNTGMMDISP